MADVAADSSVLKEESGIQPESPEEEKQQEEPRAESNNEGEDLKECSDPNIYHYIKEDLFTSEIFKVQIQNLPRYIGFNDLKKFLNKHGLNPHKIKLMGKESFAFVTFKNQVKFFSVSRLDLSVQENGTNHVVFFCECRRIGTRP